MLYHKQLQVSCARGNVAKDESFCATKTSEGGSCQDETNLTLRKIIPVLENCRPDLLFGANCYSDWTKDWSYPAIEGKQLQEKRC